MNLLLQYFMNGSTLLKLRRWQHMSKPERIESSATQRIVSITATEVDVQKSVVMYVATRRYRGPARAVQTVHLLYFFGSLGVVCVVIFQQS